MYLALVLLLSFSGVALLYILFTIQLLSKRIYSRKDAKTIRPQINPFINFGTLRETKK